MKYAPKKVFIKLNNSYIEITNEQHEHLKRTDAQYAKRKFIPLHGYLLETTEEFYEEFYRDKDRDEYLTRRAKNRDISYNDYDTDECSGEDILVDPDEDVCHQVTNKLMKEKLRLVIHLLPEEERILIEEHFYQNIPQTELALKYGKNQSNISRQITKILQKLKFLMEN